MEVHYHFIKEKVFQDEIEMLYIKMDDQVADLFTKSLSIEKFQKFQQQLNMDQRMKVGVGSWSNPIILSQAQFQSLIHGGFKNCVENGRWL